MERKLCTLGIVLLSAVLIFSGLNVYWHLSDEKESEKSFDELIQLMPSIPAIPSNERPNQETPVTTDEKYNDIYALNNDMVGWISIDGTKINYPVMQSKDNPTFYLKNNFEKQYSDYGVPFIEGNCDINLSGNIIIYGHHMRNGTMFSGLENYKSIDFYESRKIIHFDTFADFGRYEIIAVFKTVAYSDNGFKYNDYYNITDEIQFYEYVTKCKELSFYDTGLSAEYGDKLITLSTCEYSNTNGRLVIVAKKITD